MFNPIEFDDEKESMGITCELCGEPLTANEKTDSFSPAFAFSGKRFLCSYCQRNINLSIMLE